MARGRRKQANQSDQTEAKTYRHLESDSPLRPDVGTQAQFRKKKPPKTYRYDSSLSPALDWDGQNPARELGEWLLAMIEKAAALPAPQTFDKPREFRNSAGQVISTVRGLQDAVEQLKCLQKPFLNWTGKAERLSFDVPTLPLFVHERLSTKAIIETLKSHRKQERPKQLSLFDLFADEQRSVTDQVLKAYEYRDKWVNRMILGDSLVVMNSLLHYEGLGGQVQMIYFDPPYGIKFGSNFQPFIRKRDVGHNDDEDMTREPEMVKAYRDTWELGLHSYLTYMRDRLLLARDLLTPTGSIFVQISDENVHHVRSILDEVFGVENFVREIIFTKTRSLVSSEYLTNITDFILWYSKDIEKTKMRKLYELRKDNSLTSHYEDENGNIYSKSEGEKLIEENSSLKLRAFMSDNLIRESNPVFKVEFNGKIYEGGYRTSHEGMEVLIKKDRIFATKNQLRYKFFLEDFPASPLNQLWADTIGTANKIYVVQTNEKIIQRCLLMTTDPGDLVLDPTCVREGTLVLTPSAVPTPLNPPVNGGRTDSETTVKREKSGNVTNMEKTTPSPFTGRAGVGFVGTRFTPIESLIPGDYVYSHDGKPHRVIRTIKRRYHGTMIGIRHKLSPDTLWLTEDHPVLIKTRRHAFTHKRNWEHVPKETFSRARSLRKEMTPYERKLWSKLRGEQLGVKFRRQHPVGSYIADFYCAERSLVVEIDGNSHFSDGGKRHDEIRTEYLTNSGLGVLRFTNRDIQANLEGVVERISLEIGQAAKDNREDTVWLIADKLQTGDTVFYGTDLVPVQIAKILHEETTEYVYDLEVEGAHSFLTNVCAVHNCGSGTTAYVAEQWGRRWITIDTSRVPLALARQRLLTATFPYYVLKDEARGPVGGFVYKRKQNNKGEEIGGIVPHVTLKSIANNEPPAEEVLVDRPELDNKITRVTGPFCVEATIPTPVDWEGDGVEDSCAGTVEQHGSFIDRMLEILRKSPVLHVGGGKSITLKNIRPPAKTLSLSAEAVVFPANLVNGKSTPLNPPVNGGRTGVGINGGKVSDDVNGGKVGDGVNGGISKTPSPFTGRDGVGESVALLFGPENGAVSEKLVHEALKEANLRGYTHLYVIGVGIQSNARILIENAVNMGMSPATYVQATPDIMMGDLLKNMRSSQIFSVCGLPEVKINKIKPQDKNAPPQYQAEILGLDVLDPVSMELDKKSGNDVPAWFLDTDYNGLCFHVCQAFFPRTSAWDNLRRALKGSYDESVWEHLAGTKSVPFEAGEHGQIAVKVIDDRGNELMVVKSLKEIKE